MKNIFMMIAVLAMVCITSAAYATPKSLPLKALVSAEIIADGTKAIVTITGVEVVDVEVYPYFKKRPDHLGAVTTFTLDLINDACRFNFKFKAADGKVYFAGIAEDLFDKSFVGSNIGFDCRNRKGCCFIIVIS